MEEQSQEKPIEEVIKSAMKESIHSLESRFGNLEKGQSEMKESIHSLASRLGNLEKGQSEMKESIQSLEGKFDKKLKKLKKHQKKLDIRIDNIKAARNLPVYPRTPRSSYVAEGKPDHASYVSSDMIEPLPKFYR